MTKTVLDVKIDDISSDQALQIVEGWLTAQIGSVPKLVVTPGPEFLLTAQKDPEFKKILNSADLSLADGFGLVLYGGVRNRVPGFEFMVRLCREAAINSWKIGLIGGVEGAAFAAGQKLREKFPGLVIGFTIDGNIADKVLRHYGLDRSTGSGSEVLPKLPDVEILFVGLGHPKQEKLLAKLRDEPAWFKFKVGMGVGGSFDYISGSQPQPPRIIRALGFEWLWRGFKKKGHWPRIFRATVEFPIVLIFRRG